MKRTIIAFLSIVIGLLGAFSQEGTWSGSLSVQGVKLPLVFHLSRSHSTLDSPAQGAKGIPMKVSRIEPDIISIGILAIGASFTGKYQDDKIVGIFSQRGVKIPLTLVQGEEKSRRPQTPRPPFPYSQKEVSFENGDAVLKGTLTLPDGYDRDTPVLIMVTGSGLQNRDEEIYEHKPFAVIADALARHGIASLRYDDRGFGESSGDAVNCTTSDLMHDALSGINLLREQFNRVGVLGHSEGGTIALMLGAENRVDFIVSLAGMVISGKETLMDQNQYALSQAGYPQATTEEYCSLLSLAFDGDETISEKLEASGLPVELKKNLQLGLGQLNTPYMQYFLKTNLREKLNNVRVPVLALNGTEDTQVDYQKNLDALKNGLPANKFSKAMAMEGLNHMFQHCETGSTAEYATIEETISPDVLAAIYQWINTLK